MIFRTVHNSENPYFQMNRASVDDERLSYKAIGIHTYLMSKPDKWEANEVDITNRHSDGKASVRAGVQELIEFGYMVRIQIRKDKKIVGWRLDTYETPELNPHYKAGEQAEYVVVDLDSENQNVASDLDSDFQDVGNQDVGNRNHSNYLSKENNKKQGVSDAPAVNGAQKLMDAAQNKWDKRKANGGTYFNDWQLDLNKKVEAKTRTPLAEHLAELFGLSAKMETDDKTLRTMHEQTVTLYQMGYTTAEQVDALFNLWMSDDWRKKNLDKLTIFKFTDFASQKKQEENQRTQPQKRVVRIYNQYTQQYEERTVA